MGGNPNVEMMLKAVSHETRRRIMKAILERHSAASPLEFAEWLGERLSNVSYHVRVLADCHALTLDHTKAVRGSTQHFYRPSETFQGLTWVSTMLSAGGEAKA